MMRGTPTEPSSLAEFADQVLRISTTRVREVARLIVHAFEHSHTLWAAGNGGSASTASHFASDLLTRLVKSAGPVPRVFSLVDSAPTLTALTNDVGWENVYSLQLDRLLTTGDILVVFSVNGASAAFGPVRSSNLTHAVETGRAKGCTTVVVSGGGGGPLAELADIALTTSRTEPWIVEPLHSLIAHLVIEDIAYLIDVGTSALAPALPPNNVVQPTAERRGC